MDVQLWPDEADRPASSSVDPSPSWQVLLGACIAALVIMGATAQAAYLTERFSEEVWLARAEVEYRGDSLVETIAVAMSSPGVWGPIAVEYGIPIEEFEKRYRAEVVGGTQALSVEFEDPDPQQAQLVVSDVIESFLVQFTVIDDSVANETLQQYLDGLQATEADLLLVLSDRTDLTRNEQIDRQNELLAVRQAITQVLLRLDGRATELDELALQQPRVISDPYVLPEPIEPEPLKMAVVGAGAGLLLAVAAAFFVFHRDEASRRDDEESRREDGWELAA